MVNIHLAARCIALLSTHNYKGIPYPYPLPLDYSHLWNWNMFPSGSIFGIRGTITRQIYSSQQNVYDFSGFAWILTVQGKTVIESELWTWIVDKFIQIQNVPNNDDTGDSCKLLWKCEGSMMTEKSLDNGWIEAWKLGNTTLLSTLPKTRIQNTPARVPNVVCVEGNTSHDGDELWPWTMRTITAERRLLRTGRYTPRICLEAHPPTHRSIQRPER